MLLQTDYSKNKYAKKHYHLIGVAGIGMSGLARLLIAQGHAVSGSDLVRNSLTDLLTTVGVVVHHGHTACCIDACDYVVYSSAIQYDNPEILAARNANIPVLTRADLLAKIAQNFYQIVIAGSHGKTTTTSLMTHLLLMADLDPSYAIGGILNQSGVNAHLGQGEAIVLESDESDGSFLKFSPDVAMITNVDADHLDYYQGSMTHLEVAFFNFMNSVSPEGLVIICADDPRLYRLAQQLKHRVILYSTDNHPEAQYHATEICIAQGQSRFNLIKSNETETEMVLAMPGKHNVSNALGCIILSDEMQIPRAVLRRALQNFSGVGRRLQTYFLNDFMLVDDYGHHPREIEATLRATRDNWPGRKIIVVFQPHRYTRTQQLFQAFVDVLSTVDELILLDLYSANEIPILNVNSDVLAEAIKHRTVVHRLSGQSALLEYAHQNFYEHSVVIMQGAGSIGSMVQPLIESFQTVKSNAVIT